MTGTRIAVVILTLNEEKHLAACLDSLRHLGSPVLVLDSGSSDRTQQIAVEAGVRVETRAFDGYASQRNAALELASDADWVLFLDADERLTASGTEEIVERTSSATDDIAGFWVPRRNMFFGRQVVGGGWWPDHQARLLRVGCARFDVARQVHEVVVFDGRSGRLDEPLVHINYESRLEFVRKQRAYTRQRVRLSEHVDRPRFRSYVSAPVREFYGRFIALRGYRDGLTGLFLAAVLAVEELRACWLLRRRGA